MKKIFTIVAYLAIFYFRSYAQWGTSGSNIYNTNTGNVGIGTTSATAALSVAPNSTGQTNQGNSLLIGSPTLLGNTAGSYLYPFELHNSNTANLSRFQITPYRRIAGSTWSGTAYRLQMAVDNSFTDGSLAYVELGASDPNASYSGFISLGTGGADRLSVTGAGNVGIGTTSPGNMLELYKYTGTLQGGPGITLKRDVTASGFGSAIYNGWIAGGQFDTFVIGVSHNGDPAAAGNEKLVVGSNGNVGIGTTTPDEKLAVNGTIHSKEVKVDLTGWEDKVFKRTYKLPTLSTIKTYINLNHHLPDMPSEQELVKSGLNLGNMEEILTKKVEELTLYMIDKDKQASEQQRQISDQQKEIGQLKTQLNLLIKEIHKTNN